MYNFLFYTCSILILIMTTTVSHGTTSQHWIQEYKDDRTNIANNDYLFQEFTCSSVF